MRAGVAIANPAQLAAPSLSRMKEIYYRVRYFINGYPLLYMPLVRYQHRDAVDRVVTPETDLVIEGFGRSGSTFANFAFLAAQTHRVRTVHHTHAAAQVIAAARMGIPTLVIVRRPLEVALSHMVRHQVSAAAALAAWIHFHRRILPYRKRIVPCSFEQMISNFTPVIERINAKFDTCFGVWQHTKENEAEIFEQIRTRNRGRFASNANGERMRALALPTAEREAEKQRLSGQLQAAFLAPLREKAQHLYDCLLED
jgi:hypothetical protein